jgi:hypothetical protein
MRSRIVSVRALQPRTRIVLAIVRRVAGIAARRHRGQHRAARHEALPDLAQRVRESGEW